MILFLLVIALVLAMSALFLATLVYWRQLELEPLVRATFGMLRVWADTWGEPTEVTRERLQAVLKSWGLSSNRKEPPQSMGMDFGLGQLWDVLMGRR